MPIASSDLKVYRSAEVSDLGSNGGVISTTQTTSGVAGNIFPNVTQAQRVAGLTQHRKVFFKNANPSELVLFNGFVYQDSNTPGDDKILWWPGTHTDLQSAITGSERKYGCGTLNALVTAGATTFTVNVEDGAADIIQAADVIRVTDKATPGGAGNEEFATVLSRVVTGNQVAVTLTVGLTYGYASASKVSTVYAAGDVKPTVSAGASSSVGGTLNVTGANMTLYNLSTDSRTVTLTFTSPTAYNLSGGLGAGTVAGGCAPINPATGTPYFTLNPTAFGGAFLSGDTFSFTTAPAAVPMWVRRVVPAASAVIGDNPSVFVLDGETA